MMQIASLILSMLLMLTLGCHGKNPRVLFETGLGDITVEVYEKQAPGTAANFLRYVDESRFADMSFYRVVRVDNQTNPVEIAVIQGGLGFDDHPQRLPAIAHETTEATGIRHENGTISMARMAPGTASSEIFICVGEQPELDFGGKRNPDGQGFAAFGKVIQGMDVVHKIHQQSAEKQMLKPIVKINRVLRSER